jgi:hypothetical protein
MKHPEPLRASAIARRLSALRPVPDRDRVALVAYLAGTEPGVDVSERAGITITTMLAISGVGIDLPEAIRNWMALASATIGSRARHADVLAGKAVFRRWLATRPPWNADPNPDVLHFPAAAMDGILTICRMSTWRDLAAKPDKARLFDEMVAAFNATTGRQTSPPTMIGEPVR